METFVADAHEMRHSLKYLSNQLVVWNCTLGEAPTTKEIEPFSNGVQKIYFWNLSPKRSDLDLRIGNGQTGRAVAVQEEFMLAGERFPRVANVMFFLCFLL